MEEKENTDLHIGEMIRAELERQERKVSWLARKINCDRSNTYKMLHRDSMDLKLLIKISKILNHNFLEDCTQFLNELKQATNQG